MTLDHFISTSTEFIDAFPETTLLITYSKKRVSFKLYSPATGKLIKYRTSKLKEVSRLLNFVGGGVVMDGVNVSGLGEVMTNAKFDTIEDASSKLGEDKAGAASDVSDKPKALPSKKVKKKKKKN